VVLDFNYFQPYFGALEPDWLQPAASGVEAAAAAEDVAVAQASAQRLKADLRVRPSESAPKRMRMRKRTRLLPRRAACACARVSTRRRLVPQADTDCLFCVIVVHVRSASSRTRRTW
jgi:hypothetical protein